MNYKQTLDFLFEQLPMYQRVGKAAYKANLNNTLAIDKHLEFPHKKFKSIHIAGTNGKGSVAHILTSVLQKQKYKVGLYTSPHLKDFRERIKINGQMIPENEVVKFVENNSTIIKELKPSFFEITVAMAFDYFAKQEVDIAVIEVGMGGRLDSTNIITPELSVITNIGFDHMQFLGNTLPEIAGEKAGIIKQDIPVVIGETNPETESVFKSKAKETNSEIYFADQLIKKVLECDLKGSYQIHNIKTALQSVEVLRASGFKISKSEIEKGLLNVVKNTGLKGRWQILDAQPTIVCDTAHNKEGLSYVMKQIDTVKFKVLHIVFGVVNDKDLNSIIPLLPQKAIYYFCRPDVQRGLDAEILRATFAKSQLIGSTYNSVSEALNSAKSKANKEDLIYVGGSTFVVAEII
jgi:dihydrofolate synthase/folylpolyglutamate synthase